MLHPFITGSDLACDHLWPLNGLLLMLSCFDCFFRVIFCEARCSVKSATLDKLYLHKQCMEGTTRGETTRLWQSAKFILLLSFLLFNGAFWTRSDSCEGKGSDSVSKHSADLVCWSNCNRTETYLETVSNEKTEMTEKAIRVKGDDWVTDTMSPALKYQPQRADVIFRLKLFTCCLQSTFCLYHRVN